MGLTEHFPKFEEILTRFKATSIPRPITHRLAAYCRAEGELPSDVVADAIELHLDACEADPRLWADEYWDDFDVVPHPKPNGFSRRDSALIVASSLVVVIVGWGAGLI